jgi:hypothetical protein
MLDGSASTENLFECARSGRGTNELLCATIGANNLCVKAVNTAAGGVCGTGELQSPACLETEYCSANVCTPRRALGQPCTNTITDVECQAGLRCANGPGGVQCRAYLDLGATCTASGECKNFLNCTGTGASTCTPQYAGDGGSCGGGVQCASGFCGADGGCTAPQATGATCSGNPQCASYTCSTTCQAACW